MNDVVRTCQLIMRLMTNTGPNIGESIIYNYYWNIEKKNPVIYTRLFSGINGFIHEQLSIEF